MTQEDFDSIIAKAVNLSDEITDPAQKANTLANIAIAVAIKELNIPSTAKKTTKKTTKKAEETVEETVDTKKEEESPKVSESKKEEEPKVLTMEEWFNSFSKEKNIQDNVNWLRNNLNPSIWAKVLNGRTVEEFIFGELLVKFSEGLAKGKEFINDSNLKAFNKYIYAYYNANVR